MTLIPADVFLVFHCKYFDEPITLGVFASLSGANKSIITLANDNPDYNHKYDEQGLLTCDGPDDIYYVIKFIVQA